MNRNFGVARAAPHRECATASDEATLYGEGTVEPLRGVTITADVTSPIPISPARFGVLIAISRLSESPRAKAARTERGCCHPLRSPGIFDGLTVFGRFEQGFRPGGLAVRRDVIQRFQEDRLSTVEAGARYTETACPSLPMLR